MRRRSNRSWLCLAGLVAACGAPSEGPITTNPLLERWCDKHPCGWEVQGEIKQVGTWHPNDFAIALISDDAALSQHRAELDSARATCLAFSVMAFIPAGARAYFEIDFLDDAEIEFSKRIPTSDWQVRTFTIATPTWYQGARFIVRKAGPGQVVVAELNVELGRDECSETPLPLMNRPGGAPCENDEQCASGSCPDPGLSDGGTCD